jgi:hypothetical protein
MRRLILGCLTCLTLAPWAVGQGTKVTFRDDNTVLVNKKPFFPIGLVYCFEEQEDVSGKQLAALRAYGFNTMAYYNWGTPHWREEMDRIHKAGFMVWMRGASGFEISAPAAEKTATEQLRQMRDHPALLFWEFQDEPVYNKISVDGSRKGQELVRREDPNHPLLVVECPDVVDQLGKWKGLGDVFSIDLYPIPPEIAYGKLPNRDITQIRDYMAAIKQVHGDRPIVMVLQAWAWKPLEHGERGFPTVVQSRFMAYQAVIHGAKGLFYYGQYHCTKPNGAASLISNAKDPAQHKAELDKCFALNRQFWEKHRSFYRELEQMTGVFVLADAPKSGQFAVTQQEPAKAQGIELRTKRSDTASYVLAVNADKTARTATFRLPQGVDVKEMHVLFEDRRLPVSDGTFRDQFKPYDTHVYATTPRLPH